MQDQPPSQEPTEARKKGEWRRPLSYLLLIAGAAGILFNNQVSQNTGISVIILQVATFALFIAGAALFFSVRETTDRVSTYREVFNANDKPSDLPLKDHQSTDKNPPS